MRIELDIPNEVRNKVTLTVHPGLDSSNPYDQYGLTPSSFVGYGHPYQPYKYDPASLVPTVPNKTPNPSYNLDAFLGNRPDDKMPTKMPMAKIVSYVGRLVKFEFDGKQIYGITIYCDHHTSTIITLNTITTAPIYGESTSTIIDRLRSDLFVDKFSDKMRQLMRNGYDDTPFESVDLPKYSDIYGDKYHPLRPTPMAVECLRIAKSFEGEIQSYWLADSDEDGKEFMCVEEDGNPSTDMGSNARGIRVKFEIDCDIVEKGMLVTDPTEIESILCTAKPMK
jgi:hypothetical protein